MNRRTLLTLGIVSLALAVALAAAGWHVYQQEAATVAAFNADLADLRLLGSPLGDGPDATVVVPPAVWALAGSAVVCLAGAGFCLYWTAFRLRPPAAAPGAPADKAAEPERPALWKRRHAPQS
jgi:hypothetical protein